MTIENALSILQAIRRTSCTELLDEMIRCAIQYARMRTDWALMDPQQRRDIDALRTQCHNVFIDSCNILSRAMNRAGESNLWRDDLGSERGEIGDFACYLHCLLGLSAR